MAAGGSVTTTDATRHVKRLVASPTPLDTPFWTFTPLSDRASWKVEVDPMGVVLLDARSSDTSPFFLRYHPWGESGPSSPLPGAAHSPTLSGAVARAWRVDVDPAAGVGVEITVRFTGRLIDDEGRAWPFTLTDVPMPSCPEGTCLP